MASTIGGTLDPVRNGSPKLRLLGAVELDGPVSLRFLPERRYRLLAYLALHGSWVARDSLAHLFWPDRTQEAARSNLRKLVLEARLLGALQLETDRHALRWDVATDVAELLDAHARGDNAAVCRLYRGPLLDSLDGSDSAAYADWLHGERVRMRTLWRESVLGAVVGATPETTIKLCQRLIDDDPYEEDAVRAQMRALAALGRVADVAKTYRSFAERVAEGLGVDVTIETRNLARELQGERPAPLASTSAATFIGRAREIEEISALLRNPECRLLSVTGPGGVGKSRLAKEVVRRVAARYIDGVLWIALDDVNDASQVVARIVAERGLSVPPGQDPIECFEAESATKQVLLILDNAEHLPEIRVLIERLIAAAAQLQVLCTSRARIGMAREWLFPLEGLARSAPDASASEHVASDAVRLFVAHAQAGNPRFEIGSNTASVVKLVHAVGGLPLAIMLAASWVRLLPVAELANEVTRSLDILESAEEGEERAEHRSVRVTFEQSWRLLAPAEQKVLAALSVFVGGFSRAAAFAVAGAPILLLSSLVDKSLLQSETDGDDARFQLHPLLRHFARDKMRAVDERRNLLSRHALYFSQWLADIENALRGVDQPRAAAELERQLPDCQAAWAYATEHQDARFIERATLPLMYYYEARGRRADGIALFSAAERALDTGAPGTTDGALALLARALSTLRYRSGEIALTIDTATRGIAFARRAGARSALKGCLLNLGLAHYQRAQLNPARHCFEEALALARADRDLPGIGAFLSSLAMVEQEAGDSAAAETHYREVLGIFRELQNARGMLTALNNLAQLLLVSGKVAEALPLYEEGLRLGAHHGIVVMRANFLLGLGGTRLALDQIPSARELTQQAIQAAQASGEPHVAVEAQMQLARISLAASDVALALRSARDALRQSAQLENLPILLNAAHCFAECQMQVGEVRVALALWLFIIAHPKTSDSDRRRIQQMADDTALPDEDRAWAVQQAQRYELSNLADALTGSIDNGDVSSW